MSECVRAHGEVEKKEQASERASSLLAETLTDTDVEQNGLHRKPSLKPEGLSHFFS